MTIHVVHDLFGKEHECKTRVWISASALKGLQKFRRKGDPNGQFFQVLSRCAKNGFKAYINAGYLVPERSGVYRFGIPASLFRLIGFYEDDSQSSFIVIECYLKLATKLGPAEKKCIKRVAEVMNKRRWERYEDEKHEKSARRYPN